MAGTWKRTAVWTVQTVALAVLAAGCATAPSIDDKRIARYRPEEQGRNPVAWASLTQATVVAVADTNATASVSSPPGLADSVTNKESSAAQKLRRGDSIRIYLKWSKDQDELRVVIGGNGQVNLPLIGNVDIADKTPPEAEKYIESMYVDGKYYKKITVIVVPAESEYFIQGEVKHEGKFVITGDLTLMQAIAQASGFTDYAQKKEINLRREGKVQVYNGERINAGLDTDPLVKAGDTIFVPRRWY